MSVMREVTITPVLNGFVCRVGCQTLVFTTMAEVAQNLISYQKNPEIVEKAFRLGAVNKTLGEDVRPPEPYLNGPVAGYGTSGPLGSYSVGGPCVR